MEKQQQDPYFPSSPSVQSDRILYTPSPFARANLLHLQEIGHLQALAAHTSSRDRLRSFLCFLVEKGSGQLTYQGRVYLLEAGDVVFIDCMKPYAHSTRREELWTLRWCHFYGPSLPAVYAKYCERGGEPVIRPGDSDPFVRLLTRLQETAGSDDYIRDMRINEELSGLLTCLMEESWHQGRHQGGSRKMDVAQVKAYLDGHYREKLTLESVAEYFFINKYYLARLFREKYGVTLTTYLQQVRITHAKRLLRFTDKKIESIGMECGVGELPYFSRVFKKMEGVSPSEYRNMW